MLKVLHTGDLHLGMTHKTRNYPESLRLELVNARYRALEHMVKTANEEGCQLIIIAGDLFHSNHVQKSVVKEAVKALNLFAGACIAVLPGNHDFYNDLAQVWKMFCEEAPEHVLLLKEPKPYELTEYGLDAVLYPAPCDRKHSDTNRLGWIYERKERAKKQWHLGVAHGSVQGISPDFDSRYFPMERDELLHAELDHWFLGHTHIRYPDAASADNCGFAYCGTPEPDGFDCAHAGYAWLTSINDQGDVHIRAVQTGCYQYKEIKKDVYELEDLKELFAQTAADHLLVKLLITGRLSQQEYHMRADFIRQLAEQFAYLEYDDSLLAMEISSQSIDDEFPVGTFGHLFLSSLAKKGSQEALQLAYELVKKVKKQ